jgi:hypothetical protein
MQFQGTLEELKDLVAGLGEPGHWIHEGPFDEFLFDGGERLNWWSGSGRLTLVGHPAEVRSLTRRLLDFRPELLVSGT